MSVYIKGMGMPTNCEDCIFCDGDACLMHKPDEFRSWAEEYKNCPLVPVPPHGRLIDADALLESELGYTIQNYNSDGYVADLEGAYTEVQIENAPTIIPADKEGE